MEDTTFEFTNREQLIGYVETDSGGLVIADGIWGDEFPSVSQERICVNLGILKGKVPVYAVSRNGKRYLLLALDAAVQLPALEGLVNVTDLPVEETDAEGSGDSR